MLLLLGIALPVMWWHYGILDARVAQWFGLMAAAGVLLVTLFAIALGMAITAMPNGLH